MKYNTRIFLTLFFLCAAFSAAFGVFAAEPTSFPLGQLDSASIGSGGGGEGIDIADTTDMVDVITNLVNWFAWIIALASVVMGLYAGLLFITARGETAQLSTAKKTFAYAMIGVAVALVSFSIIAITKAFF